MDFKIYIVDNHSEDGSYEKLYAIFDGNAKVCVISSPENGGYSKGNNIGIKKAGADGVDCVLIINSDVELLNDAIGIMYNQLTSDENIAVTGPSIVSPELKEQQFARKKLDFKGYIFDKKPLFWIRKYFPKLITNRKLNWNDGRQIFIFNGMVSGCCFLIEFDTFKKMGFFDENVFLFGEEDILTYKIELDQKKAAVVSSARVQHSESSSISKNGLAFSRMHRTLSALYVLRAYARLTNFEMFLPLILTIGPLTLNSIFCKSYREYLPYMVNRLRFILKNSPKKLTD